MISMTTSYDKSLHWTLPSCGKMFTEYSPVCDENQRHISTRILFFGMILRAMNFAKLVLKKF